MNGAGFCYTYSSDWFARLSPKEMLDPSFSSVHASLGQESLSENASAIDGLTSVIRLI